MTLDTRKTYMGQTIRALRLACLLTLFTEASCAGDFVSHGFDFPGQNTTRLEIRDPSGAVLKSITDQSTIQAFDAAIDRIDRWFDDIWDKSGAPQYDVELFGPSGVWVGSLSVTPKYIRYVPGKGAAKINSREREQFLRILGLPAGAQKGGV